MYLIIIVIKYIVHPTSKQIFIINHLSAFLETHVLFLIKCVKGISALSSSQKRLFYVKGAYPFIRIFI